MHVYRISFMPREVAQLLSNGMDTACVVNVDLESISVVCFARHCVLLEATRRAPFLASQHANAKDPGDWLAATGLADLVVGAVLDAPIDVRRELLDTILVSDAAGGTRFKDQAVCDLLTACVFDRYRASGRVIGRDPRVRPVEDGITELASLTWHTTDPPTGNRGIGGLLGGFFSRDAWVRFSGSGVTTGGGGGPTKAGSDIEAEARALFPHFVWHARTERSRVAAADGAALAEEAQAWAAVWQPLGLVSRRKPIMWTARAAGAGEDGGSGRDGYYPEERGLMILRNAALALPPLRMPIPMPGFKFPYPECVPAEALAAVPRFLELEPVFPMLRGDYQLHLPPLPAADYAAFGSAWSLERVAGHLLRSVWTRAGHFVLLRALTRKGRASPRPPAEDGAAAAVAAAEAEAMARVSAAKGAAAEEGILAPAREASHMASPVDLGKLLALLFRKTNDDTFALVVRFV